MIKEREFSEEEIALAKKRALLGTPAYVIGVEIYATEQEIKDMLKRENIRIRH